MYTKEQLKVISEMPCTAAYFLGKRDVWESRYKAVLQTTTVGEVLGASYTDKPFVKLMAYMMFYDDANKLFFHNMILEGLKNG